MTQISLYSRHRKGWPEQSLFLLWEAKGLKFLHAGSEDWSDYMTPQTDLSLRWAHMSLCCFCHVPANCKSLK